MLAIQNRPVVSSNPNSTLKFWIAWPAAPLTRLSMHADHHQLAVGASTRQPMSQKFVCATCLISGRSPPVRRTNGELGVRTASARSTAAASTPGREPGVNRLEDAAVERHQVRHERDRRRRAPVRSRRRADARTRRSGDAAVALRKVRAFRRCLAGAGDAGLRVDDDAGFEQAAHRREASAQALRRSDSSPAHATRRAPSQFVPALFGQAVGDAWPWTANADTTAAAARRPADRNAPQRSNTRVPRSTSAGAMVAASVSGRARNTASVSVARRSTSRGSTGASQIFASAGTAWIPTRSTPSPGGRPRADAGRDGAGARHPA